MCEGAFFVFYIILQQHFDGNKIFYIIFKKNIKDLDKIYVGQKDDV